MSDPQGPTGPTGELPQNVQVIQPVGAQLVTSAHEEPAISISKRAWRRIKERMAKTKEGIEVLWLAGASAFFGVFASIGITLLTNPASNKRPSTQLSHSTREVLLTVLAFSIVGVIIGLVGYFSARNRRGDAIDEIIKDMAALEPPNMDD